MKTALMKALILLLSLLLAGGLMSSCQKESQERLPDVVTQGIPENEKVKNTLVLDGFTIDVHVTYAEIVEYAGSDTELVLPESATGVPVKLIGEAAFQNQTKITKVTLPTSLLTVGRYAFDGCTALTEVVFNDGLETVSDYAFRNSGLAVLNLPDSVAGIGKYSFYQTKIEALVIPDGVSRLGKYAFYGCQSLTSVEFCPRLYEIGERVFYNCTALREVVIPKTVTKIGDYAFSTCTALTKIVIPAETAAIGEGVFMNCPNLTMYAPAGSEAERCASRNRYRFHAVDYDEFVRESDT